MTSQINQLGLMAMYFVYGLSFFTMGTAIIFQYRSSSNFRLAKSLRLLAAFGMLHGLSEWGNVFIPVAAPNFDLDYIWKAIALQRLLQSVSLFFLFLFGIKLMFDSRTKSYWLFCLPITAFACWLIQFSFFIPLLRTNDLAHWLLISENWARFLLALPGGMFTAYALSLQLTDAKKIDDNWVSLNLIIATGSFFLFSLFSGIVVPEQTGWLSRIINVQTFQHYVGLPIEVFRTATALMATRSITRLLTIFDLEKQRQIAESRRLEAVFRERERFARDLHDDVIQSIYGIGLELQSTIPLIPSDRDKATERVHLSIKRLDKVIKNLRAYIQGLETPVGAGDLKAILVDILDQFRGQSGLKIELDFRLGSHLSEDILVRAEGLHRQIKQLISEALSNVVRHSGASEALVQVGIEENDLVIRVKDNGRGIPTQTRSSEGQERKHLGLQNMRTRAELMGGTLELFSVEGSGTVLIISVPLYQEQKAVNNGQSG